MSAGEESHKAADDILARLRDGKKARAFASTREGQEFLQGLADRFARYEAELAEAIAPVQQQLASQQRTLGQFREIQRLAKKYLKRGWLA